MNQKWLLGWITFLMIALFLGNQIGVEYHWDYFWWFDMILHFFGGMWVGLFFIYIFPRIKTLHLSVSQVILSVLFIGVIWEIFEIIVFNNIGGWPIQKTDIISDLFFDLSGGLLALIFFHHYIYGTYGKQG